jgi:hypothetical protein
MTLRWLLAGTFIAILFGSFPAGSACSDATVRHETLAGTRAIALQVADGQGSAGAASGTVLNVHVLVTLDGGDFGGMDLYTGRYPETIRVQQAAAFLNRISAYGAAYRVWIAPKGWTGFATIGADDSTDVDLYPAKASAALGQRFHYQNSGGCIGCAVGSAARYFPSAMRQWKALSTREPLKPLPPGLKIIRVSQNLVTYSYPRGHGLVARGAVHFDSSNQYSEQAEFVLPATDANLCKFLLHGVIRTMQLR